MYDQSRFFDYIFVTAVSLSIFETGKNKILAMQAYRKDTVISALFFGKQVSI